MNAIDALSGFGLDHLTRIMTSGGMSIDRRMGWMEEFRKDGETRGPEGMLDSD
ncbi:mitochondrial ribosomal protein Dap3 [Aspergillus luchuensis]|uniref:Mitochondrial ribosomal protein Dap3 n=1 Tax=Aspergillus kawachii TaxID=1069201 RepID=A0A146F2G8_ASPKA|nr:mitochondrial ribosomal protein Dap3 [Aspergillus luchuensis]